LSPLSDGNLVGTSGAVENVVYVYVVCFLDLLLMLDLDEDWAGLLRRWEDGASAFVASEDEQS
jgi:hypothetical protein